MRIEDTTAFVTGANRGLGRAFTEALLERGAVKVYAAARNPELVAVTDPRIVPIRLDVTDAGEVAAAAERCSDVSLLVNNAGVASVGSLLDDDVVSRLQREFETNVGGPLATTAAFAPHLAANGGGAVVNVLSAFSFFSPPRLGTYSASKAAAWSATNGLRFELGGQGALVVGVHSGFIDTEMAAGVDGPKLDPKDVASAALDAVEDDQIEVLVDGLAAQLKAALAGDPLAAYRSLA